MKNIKWLFLLFVTFLLIGCSNQWNQNSQPTVISPVTIPTQQTTPFLDFDNPRLHEIAGNKPLVIDEIVRTQNQDPEYVAVIVKTSDPMLSREMLLFRITDNVSTLIYDLGPFVYMTFDVEREDHPDWLYNGFFLKGFRGFSYFHQNYFELPVITSMGGNCYDCGTLKLIGINAYGEAIDITPATGFNPKGFVSINNQAIFRVVATRYYEGDYGACVHTASPFAFRLFAWKDTAYIDVSENEKEFYNQKITELVTGLQADYNKPLVSCNVMPTLANIFFDYESSGRVDYGWEQIKSLGDLSHWDVKNTAPEEIQSYHQVFDELEKRKNNDNATPTP